MPNPERELDLLQRSAILRRDEEIARLKSLQSCGHPVACIVSSGEGTNYCGWCASIAKMETLLVRAQSVLRYCGADEENGLMFDIERAIGIKDKNKR